MLESPNNKHAPAGSLPDKDRHCEVHGSYQAKHIGGPIWQFCPTCNTERAVREQAEADLRKEKERKARAEAIRVRNLRHSGLIGWCQEATFDNFVSESPEQDVVARSCLHFVEKLALDGGNALWLIGPPGVGKTHLGSAMVNHVIRVRGMGACIHGVHEIMAELRKRWGVREGSAWWDSDAIVATDDFISHLGEVPLLVIDEVGMTSSSDYELQHLFAIIDMRDRLRRPTALLSNLTPNELKTSLGDRVYDRLRKNAKLLVCKWSSHRGRGQGNE